MKLLSVIQFATILSSVLAGGQGDDSSCCKFTLSSAGPFSCPAGQLPDGQIRLNGTESTSTFCIDKDGKITDQNGFGCIITDPPTTQIQCDQGANPAPGFSISSDNTLLYKGSSSFFACPASDTEWNIYVAPNFGQLKCIAITLTADGCGSQTTTCSTAPASTVYQTQWTTQWMTQQSNNTVTITETETNTVTNPCTSSTTTTGGCKKCSRKSTSIYTNTSSISTSTLGWNTTTGWNGTTTVCHKCAGTGTGALTTMTTTTESMATDGMATDAPATAK